MASIKSNRHVMMCGWSVFQRLNGKLCARVARATVRRCTPHSTKIIASRENSTLIISLSSAINNTWWHRTCVEYVNYCSHRHRSRGIRNGHCSSSSRPYVSRLSECVVCVDEVEFYIVFRLICARLVRLWLTTSNTHSPAIYIIRWQNIMHRSMQTV